MRRNSEDCQAEALFCLQRASRLTRAPHRELLRAGLIIGFRARPFQRPRAGRAFPGGARWNSVTSRAVRGNATAAAGCSCAVAVAEILLHGVIVSFGKIHVWQESSIYWVISSRKPLEVDSAHWSSFSRLCLGQFNLFGSADVWSVWKNRPRDQFPVPRRRSQPA